MCGVGATRVRVPLVEPVSWIEDLEWQSEIDAQSGAMYKRDLRISEAAVAAYKRTAIAEIEKLDTYTPVSSGNTYVYLPDVLAVLEDSPDA